MTREEERIEQIEKFASQCYEDGERYSSFIAGAIFADNNPSQDIVNLNNVWHDASEEPLLEGKDIIFLNEQDEPFISGKIGGTFLFLLEDFYWERFVELVQISKWAYISDLLPKKFGNSERLKGGER